MRLGDMVDPAMRLGDMVDPAMGTLRRLLGDEPLQAAVSQALVAGPPAQLRARSGTSARLPTLASRIVEAQ